MTSPAATEVGSTLPTVEIPAQRDPGALLFDGGIVHIDLTIEDDAWQALEADPRSWVPAHVAIQGFPDVDTAVRLKGNGSFQPIGEKPSWKLDLGRFVEDSEIDGLDELVLNNMVTDPSGMREHLAYEVYRHLGVPAPRTRHAELFVNGERKGTYLLLEDADGRFLSRWFDDNDGPFYEMFDVELTPAGVWQLDHDGGPDDRSVLMALAELLEDPDVLLSEEGAEYLDIDSFAAYFGTSGVIGQFDAYPYSFPGDDVFLYVNPETEKIHMLPHGGDETFSDPERPADFVFGMLAVRCLEDPVCEARFDAAVWAAVDALDDLSLTLEMDRLADELPVERMAHNAPYTWVEVETAREDVEAFIRDRRERIERMPGID